MDNESNQINLDKLVIKKTQVKTENEDGTIIHRQIKRKDDGRGAPMAHLHLHTFHSILDGCGSIDNYIKLAKQYGHPAMGITDHGTMSGTFEFYQKCNEAGVKPLIGSEIYINDNIGKMEEQKLEGKNSHLIVYAMSQKGYENLNHLLYLSFSEGFYRRPRITSEQLFKYKEGLFVSTACLGSPFAKFVFADKSNYNKLMVESEKLFVRYKQELGDNFSVELQINELEPQKRFNAWLINMASKHDVMPVLTSDVHYAFPEDAELQDVLIAINNHSVVGESFKLHVRSLFYANSEDFHRFNKQFKYNYSPEFVDLCLSNTLIVANKCNFEFEIGKEKYPKYEVTEDVSSYFKTEDTKEIITKLAFAKLRQKLNKYKENNIVKIDDDKVAEYVNRLNYEISVIDDKKMLDYFMVNWEIIKDYRSKGHDIGPARGSAAGSLLSWCLDITKIDPIRFDLYFERFLNPTRNSPPDIDIDFETGTDHITNEFLINKYGKERILAVSTFSTFNEKGCLKDVVRAFGGDAGFNSDVFAVTKEMPDWSKVDISLRDWFKTWPQNPECSERVRAWLTEPRNTKILSFTLKLQGQIRGIGQHAAGVVITPSACWEHIPTNIIPKQKSIVTAFQEADKSGKDLSTLGILKLDRLKLETLNVIKDTIKLVKEKKGVDIQDKVDYVDLEDVNLYAELRLGMNQGIFQFESPGMNGLIRNMQTENFNEVVAANALYRPGPMGIKAHEEYVTNKFEPDGIAHAHPSLEPILRESKGVLIFQEQLMFIAKEIGGMELGVGDMLRRAMDKAGKLIDKELRGEPLTNEEKYGKKYKDFQKYWGIFVEGAFKKGLSEFDVNKVKEWLIKYLGYSFNKSHALSYSYLAMQTLYLKHYYPTEFYTALLSHPKNTTKEKEEARMTGIISSAISKGIKIKPPSRDSGWNWTMTGDKEISMGFAAINGVGEIAYTELMTELNKIGKTLSTVNLLEFFDLPLSKFNKKAYESCIKVGMFDDWSESREYLVELRTKRAKKKTPGNQMALFDMNDESMISKLDTSKHKETTPGQIHTEFVEVAGFDLTKIEEMSKIKQTLADKAGRIIESIINFDNDDYYFFILDHKRELTVENGKNAGSKYAELKVGDGINTMRLRVFGGMYEKIKPHLERGGVYVSSFVKSEKGFINFKKNAGFKRVF